MTTQSSDAGVSSAIGVAGLLSGVWAPVCAPLDSDGTIDGARLVDHIECLLGSGCHGVVLFGTTGEATSFSVAERKAALETMVARGVDPGRVIVGTGCASVADSVALSSHALAGRYTNLLVLPPFFYKGVGDEGLFNNFAAVIEGIGDPAVRVYLYHIPQISHVPITHELIGRLLSEYGTMIAGLKDSSGDADGTERFIRSFPDLGIFPGDELAMLRLLRGGARGCITATANAISAPIRDIYDLWLVEDSAAAEAQERISAFRNVVDRFPRIPALKHLIARATGDNTWRRVRPPLVELTPQEADELEGEIDAFSD